MKRFLQLTVASVALLGVTLVSTPSFGDDERQTENQRARRVEFRVVGGQYWIGVQTAPVDEALKSHLDLADRILIAQVVPDSPAAKVGLKKYDIILSFGEHNVTSLEDLAKAVTESKGEEREIKLLRGGKPMEVTVKAVERPESIAFTPDASGWVRPFERWMRSQAGNPNRLRLIGPGIVAGADIDVPGNLSVQVRKEDDQPAKITVKRGDEQWEVTEETIDELPEDVRPHVQRLMGRARGPNVYRHEFQIRPDADGAIRLPQEFPVPHRIDPALPPRFEEVLKQFEEMQRRFESEDPFKALREEMESLRREIEKLQQGDGPSGEDNGADESDGTVDA